MISGCQPAHLQNNSPTTHLRLRVRAIPLFRFCFALRQCKSDCVGLANRFLLTLLQDDLGTARVCQTGPIPGTWSHDI